MVGLSFDEYWNLSPREYILYLECYEEKERIRVQEQDYLNYLLGAYIRLAYHDPEHYPDKPYLSETKKENENEAMSDEEMEEEVRRINLLFGGIDHGTNS